MYIEIGAFHGLNLIIVAVYRVVCLNRVRECVLCVCMFSARREKKGRRLLLRGGGVVNRGGVLVVRCLRGELSEVGLIVV